MAAARDYVTVVSGLPRSGTSMMMKMLDVGGIAPLIDNIRTADEDNPGGYYEFEPVKKTREDSSWVAQAVGRVVKLVHLIILDLPTTYQYRVIFMRRHLDEVVKSQNVMLERKGKNTADLPPERLKSIYLAQIQKVQQYMQDHAACIRFIEVEYNAVMKNPQPEAERLSAFLDGLDVERMTGVVSPELYRNRAKS